MSASRATPWGCMHADGGPDSTSTTRSAMSAGSTAPGARAYLLVLEGDSSSIFHLPRTGAVLIGRSEEADLRLRQPGASRRHARLLLSDGQVRLADLDSHNGTRLNGEPLAGTRLVQSGDVITICNATLVLHSAAQPPARRPLLAGEAFRERLAEELQRALEYERPLSLLVLAPGAHPALPTDGLEQPLRLMDALGQLEDGAVAVLLPERTAEEARQLALSLLEALPGARAGLATTPQDGCEAHALLALARAAALAASPATVADAGVAVTRFQLGERTVLVADPAMVRLYALIQRLAGSELPVLVTGETGAGKENAAYAVHHWSSRSRGPFVALNCAAIPESLVESELFGHEKGAFTGAAGAKMGLLESAGGGTVFLDEVGELPLSVQAKLLRVLETRRLTRVGGLTERTVDIRVVAATHRRLEAEVAAGRFREDLFFRLSGATVVLPPLRDRPQELPLLARTFLADARERAGQPALELSGAVMQRLAGYEWPGNVRELKNAMEYAAVVAPGGVVEVWHLPERVRGSGPEPEAPAAPAQPAAAPVPVPPRPAFRPISEELRELERRRMEEALEAAGGVQTRAAELICMPLRTFVLKLKQYGLSPRAGRRAGAAEG